MPIAKPLRSALLVVAWALCWAGSDGSAVAQEQTGRMEGVITKDGEGVAGVTVLINELKRVEVSDGDGKFVFDKMPVGSYTLILTLGENTLARPVILTGERTMQLTFEVDWNIGVQQRVNVTAAAVRAAKIVDAPAAVTSIQEEQIETQASHGQVPKILEFTPGAEVTQSGLYDFNFNTRGFNSSLNRRVSTYIDGRDVGVVLLGAQEWAAISGGLDDVASLEFIRGPSAALYGANASSGVINITTKAPRDSLGSLLRLTAGELETRSLDFRRADSLGNGWYSKIIAGFKNSGDFSISRNPDGPDNLPDTPDDLEAPEYSVFCDLVGETDCLPEEKTLFREQDNEIRFGSVRFDKYLSDEALLTFEAGVSDIKGPVFQTGIGRVQILGATRPFYRFNYATPRWNVLVHYSSREGDQANLTKSLVADFKLITDTVRYGIEGQWNKTFMGGKARFVIGAAHTEEEVDTTDPETGEQTVVFAPIETDRQAVFSQFDYTLNEHVKFVFAGRVDANTLHDTQFSPKAAMVYSINPKNSLRFTYNEAFQVANYSEFFLHARLALFPLLGFQQTICGAPLPGLPVDCGITEDAPVLAVGNDDLQLEHTNAWEVGYSGLLANRVFVTVDYYNADNEDFITDLLPQFGTELGNTEDCFDERSGAPETNPRNCPVNNDYLPWVSTDEAENTFIFGTLTVAQALRNAVMNSVAGTSLGFRLAQDLDGSTVIVARTYTNVGQVDTQGVDFGIQYFINDAWGLQASYSWFDFEIVDSDITEDPSCDLPPGHPDRLSGCVEDILLPNSPEHKASLSVSFRKKKWSASIGGRWVEGFRWSAGVFQGDVPLPDKPLGTPEPGTTPEDNEYTTVDLSASYSFNDIVAIGINVANLTDNVHRQTFGGDLLSRRALANLTLTW